MENDDADYILLESPCPTLECKDDRELRKWCHAICGSRSQINSEGMVRCSSCKKASIITTWRFACEKHANDYRPVDIMGLTAAILIMRSVSTDVGDRQWYSRLLKTVSTMVLKQSEDDAQFHLKS